MPKKYKVYDTESGRVVSIIERVADAVRLAAGVLTSGSAEVTVTSTTGLWPGMLLIGKGITAGTKVLTVDSATGFTMTANASATVNAPGVFITALAYVPYKADGTLEVREVHLDHYRDLFSSLGLQGHVVDADTGSLTFPKLGSPLGGPEGVGIIPDPDVPLEVDSLVGTLSGVAVVKAAPKLVLSDHIAHTPPREQTQKCSFVHFILDDGTLLPVLRMPAYDIVPVAP